MEMITVILNFPRKKTLTYYFEQSKSNHFFFILEKKDLGLTFCVKNALTLLKRLTITFKCLALPKRNTN